MAHTLFSYNFFNTFLSKYLIFSLLIIFLILFFLLQTDWINFLMTLVFVKEPLLHRVCKTCLVNVKNWNLDWTVQISVTKYGRDRCWVCDRVQLSTVWFIGPSFRRMHKEFFKPLIRHRIYIGFIELFCKKKNRCIKLDGGEGVRGRDKRTKILVEQNNVFKPCNSKAE